MWTNFLNFHSINTPFNKRCYQTMSHLHNMTPAITTTGKSFNNNNKNNTNKCDDCDINTKNLPISECDELPSSELLEFTDDRKKSKKKKTRKKKKKKSTLPRQQHLSTESDDSLVIVFTDSRKSDNSNDLTTTKKNPQKKVQFSDDVIVHPMVHWSFAYRQARKGEWESLARDSTRFKQRINSFEHIIGEVLTKNHREKIFQERFANNNN